MTGQETGPSKPRIASTSGETRQNGNVSTTLRRRPALVSNNSSSGEDQRHLEGMAPKPFDDLFIEPAGDGDVLYGDYNSTMEDGGSGKRSYLRFTSQLPNVTRSEGGEVRLKCEAVGYPLPINFSWLKNFAPVVKNRRIRIRNKDYWSKLVITDLDVLDQGYYQCVASNAAGSVNTTSILRVNPSVTSNVASGLRGSGKGVGGNRLSANSRLQKQGIDNDDENYDVSGDDEGMKNSDEALFNVPDTAAGSGYVPLNTHPTMLGGPDRWLDGYEIKKGQCVPYRGEACATHLAGKYIKVTSDNREAIYDDDRHIRASMMVISALPNIADQCKRYSHMVACFHRFKVCDTPSPSYFGVQEASYSGQVVSICRDDCEALTNRICAREIQIAAQDALVGEGPRTLIPHCDSLSREAPRCIKVVGENQIGPNIVSSNSPRPPQWCYLDNGRLYEGEVATTKSNRPCLAWSSIPATEFNAASFSELRHAKNYCRNPGGSRSEPWCYMHTPLGDGIEEESCAILKCPPNVHPGLAGADNPSAAVLDSLSNMWHSLSSQWQFAAMTGVGALGMLLLLLLLCCACGRKGKSERRRAKRSSAYDQPPTANSVPSSMLHGHDAAGSIVSAANAKKINLLGAPSCNGVCSSIVSNSDMNSAYIRKYKEEVSRMQGGEELNPLLGYNNQQALAAGYIQQQQQHQLFEMKNRQTYWAGSEQPTYVEPPSQFHGYAHPMHALQHQQQQTEYSPHTSTEPPSEPYQIPTIQEQQLKFDKVIGEDASTIVYLGEWVGGTISGTAIQVAIKTLKPGAPLVAVDNFREEIKEVGPFEHLNVIRMHGVAYLSQTNISAVFDYMVHGDLTEFLKMREPRNSENNEQECARNNEDLLRIATQIAAGMEYLAASQYVHRDLAARNCLVGDQQVIKISDFARMKPQYEHHYYRLNAATRVPLRWLAMEALNEGRYSHASDVYAFGTTLWELYTYGSLPYAEFSDKEVIQLINEETRLNIPAHCPSILYSLMIECFHAQPRRRPTFPELHSRLQKWCSSSHVSAMISHQHRASSIHSGGGGSSSGSAALGGRNPAKHHHARGDESTGLLDQFGSVGSVPSPAPNSGQIAKLTLLGRGAGIMHSTPIRESPNSPSGGAHGRANVRHTSDDDDYDTSDSTA